MNINSYDVILGTLFLFQHNVLLGINPGRIVIGSSLPLKIQGEQVMKLASRNAELTEVQLQEYWQQVKQYAADLCSEASKAPLPPLRDINHTIPLIDENKIYSY